MLFTGCENISWVCFCAWSGIHSESTRVPTRVRPKQTGFVPGIFPEYLPNTQVVRFSKVSTLGVPGHLPEYDRNNLVCRGTPERVPGYLHEYCSNKSRNYLRGICFSSRVSPVLLEQAEIYTAPLSPPELYLMYSSDLSIAPVCASRKYRHFFFFYSVNRHNSPY